MSRRREADVLRAFADLAAADRAAIAKRLSPAERQRLNALAAKTKARGAQNDATPTTNWPEFSPALARHVISLIADAEAGASKLTPHAQAALHDCLANAAGTRS